MYDNISSFKLSIIANIDSLSASGGMVIFPLHTPLINCSCVGVGVETQILAVGSFVAVAFCCEFVTLNTKYTFSNVLDRMHAIIKVPRIIKKIRFVFISASPH